MRLKKILTLAQPANHGQINGSTLIFAIKVQVAGAIMILVTKVTIKCRPCFVIVTVKYDIKLY